MKKRRNGGKIENGSYSCKNQKARRGISLSCEKKRNYKSNTKDETDPDQANNEYLLQL